jgi:hypothetical protein
MTTLGELLGIENDPGFIAACQTARQRLDNAETRYCKNGCANTYDPGTTIPFSGFGRAGCDQPECIGREAA